MVDAIGGGGAPTAGAAPKASLEAVRAQLKGLSSTQIQALLEKDPGGDAQVQALLNNPSIKEALNDPQIALRLNVDQMLMKDLNRAFEKLMDRLAEMWKTT